MKFSCQQCSTAYNVPDEKVRGKRVRIKCKKCGAPIVVEGPKTVEARPVRSLQRTQVGGLVAPPDLAQKIRAAKAAAHAGAAASAPPSSSSPSSRWTVAIDRASPSKMTLDELVAAYADGRMTAKTLVWRKGQPEWKKPFDIPEVADALRQAGHGADGPGTSVRVPAPAPAPAPAPPAPPSSAAFDDEDEATRVVEAPSLLQLPVSTRGAAAPRPATPTPAAGATAAPQASRNEFDDDDEATAVIDPDKARALLAAQASAAKGAEPGFDDEDEATRVVDTEAGAASDRPTPSAPLEANLPGPAFDEEDDITQVATTSVARELLEKADPSLKKADEATEASTSEKSSAGAEPAVVVSDDDRASGEKSEPTKSEESEADGSQFTLQNEPTRIVQTRAKKSKTSLIVALLIVILASAAGGFLASRFVPQRSVPAEH